MSISNSPNAPTTAEEMLERFVRLRRFSELIAAPLSAEDCAMQSMPDTSPTKWHLAHTTWFFETFLLKQRSGYRPFNERFEWLFNSYYNAVGFPFPRHRRGQISRPSLQEALAYRRAVDGAIAELLDGQPSEWELRVLELGLNHEQQHQELMLTDIKHVLFSNPAYPAYMECPSTADNRLVVAQPLRWIESDGGMFDVGYAGSGFCFDNERPRHATFLQRHRLASRCVNNGEYRKFIKDGGYEKAELWLSLGWTAVQQNQWRAPLYWVELNSEWHEYTLDGLRPIRDDEPVCHVSFFEADAFSRWSGHRLPTEFEWEAAAFSESAITNDDHCLKTADVFADTLLQNGRAPHPRAPVDDATRFPAAFESLMGNVWEWTSSSYSPYPGYLAESGALGEYNGKFMCNQFVLRGGSCATVSDHIRPTYRNFFPPDARWQFSGIRLADMPLAQ